MTNRLEIFLKLLGFVFIIILGIKIYLDPSNITWWLILFIFVSSRIYNYYKK